MLYSILFYSEMEALLQVSIVGDFSEDDLESCILDYLGTVSAKTAKTVQSLDPIMFQPSPSDLQSQQVHSQSPFLD